MERPLTVNGQPAPAETPTGYVYESPLWKSWDSWQALGPAWVYVTYDSPRFRPAEEADVPVVVVEQPG